MVDTAIELSKELRDPKGPHRVDLIIALTHCRVPNDIELANQLGAVKGRDVADEHGVDLLIGGHDHIGKGATSWEGFAREDGGRGTEGDQGVYLIKSGTDFRDLSEAMLELAEQPAGSIRRRVIKSLTGKHHEITPATPSSPDIEKLVKSLLSTVTSTLSNPVCFTFTPFDVRSEKVRTQEMAIGNWVADILLHAYAEMLEETSLKSRGKGEDTKDVTGENAKEDGKGGDRGTNADGRADAVIICGGTLRGDSVYPPGKITLGDILEIMPFDDPVVCLEIDGKGIHDVLESALSKWPAQEGRFPVIAGLRVKWDHTKPPGQRLISVHLVKSPAPNGDDPEDEYENPEDLVKFFEQEDGTRVEVRQRVAVLGEEIKRDDTGRIYRVITRNYMAEGYDGFEALKNRKFIVDDDNGQIMSSIVRSFLLGSAYIFRHKQIRHEHRKHLSARTDKVISRARRQWSYDAAANHLYDQAHGPGHAPNGGLHSPTTSVSTLDDSHMSSSPVASSLISPGGTPRRHVVAHSNNDIRDALHVARHDHMSDADCFFSVVDQDGASLRAGKFSNGNSTATRSDSTNKSDNVPKAAFMVDDSNREEVRALDGELAIVSPLVDGRLMDVSADKP
ncbi:hypothetical protein QFC24_007035 [Naganishia onofrii]|uniref:Uncharacterized protein n=1 Tax=Naganishia onofrii TaxID=1851511 RepID=A0ACC2WV63_9TREE|nr:hypothetical protein QFC24_007035 [Naganishia onofrii]